uniref:Uncharacterized protein n=1 Tax=Oryza rufipogon TaxID=4529 RepID=A0A0E0QMU7_ORYRU
MERERMERSAVSGKGGSLSHRALEALARPESPDYRQTKPPSRTNTSPQLLKDSMAKSGSRQPKEGRSIKEGRRPGQEAMADSCRGFDEGEEEEMEASCGLASRVGEESTDQSIRCCRRRGGGRGFYGPVGARVSRKKTDLATVSMKKMDPGSVVEKMVDPATKVKEEDGLQGRK